MFAGSAFHVLTTRYQKVLAIKAEGYSMHHKLSRSKKPSICIYCMLSGVKFCWIPDLAPPASWDLASLGIQRLSCGFNSTVDLLASQKCTSTMQWRTSNNYSWC